MTARALVVIAAAVVGAACGSSDNSSTEDPSASTLVSATTDPNDIALAPDTSVSTTDPVATSTAPTNEPTAQATNEPTAQATTTIAAPEATSPEDPVESLAAGLRSVTPCPELNSFELVVCPTAIPAGTVFTYENVETWEGYRRLYSAYDRGERTLRLSQLANFQFDGERCRFDQPIDTNFEPDDYTACEVEAFLRLEEATSSGGGGTISCAPSAPVWGGGVAAQQRTLTVDAASAPVSLCETIEISDGLNDYSQLKRTTRALFTVQDPCLGESVEVRVTYSISLQEIYIVAPVTQADGSTGRQIAGYLDPAAAEPPPASVDLVADMISQWTVRDRCPPPESPAESLVLDFNLVAGTQGAWQAVDQYASQDYGPWLVTYFNDGAPWIVGSLRCGDNMCTMLDANQRDWRFSLDIAAGHIVDIKRTTTQPLTTSGLSADNDTCDQPEGGLVRVCDPVSGFAIRQVGPFEYAIDSWDGSTWVDATGFTFDSEVSPFDENLTSFDVPEDTATDLCRTYQRNAPNVWCSTDL